MNADRTNDMIGPAMKLMRLAIWLLACAFLPGMATADVITYYHNDLLGSPIVATDQSGAVVWRETFVPYGERMSSTLKPNKVWYTSRVQDDDTRLVYMGARHYDPLTGRFLSIDPVAFDEKSVHTFNRYAYAANNPYKYTDPNGKRFEFAANTTAEFRRDFETMRAYLAINGVDGPLREIDRHEIVITVQQGAPDVTQFEQWHGSDQNVLFIDTKYGYRTTEGGIQSPALGLLHESGHAIQWIVNGGQFNKDVNTPDAQYDTREERRVIEKIESPAARILGEPVRSDHKGTPAPVQCPVCNY